MPKPVRAGWLVKASVTMDSCSIMAVVKALTASRVAASMAGEMVMGMAESFTSDARARTRRRGLGAEATVRGGRDMRKMGLEIGYGH